MACCANTSRKAPTCPVTPSATWTRSPSPSTVGPGRPSSGRPQPRRSTSYSRLHRLVLHRSLEPKVYTSAGYRQLIKDLGMRSSMGRTGVCWDNAMAESFFSAVKNERVYRTVYATTARAKSDVIAYIEGFYNSRRRHSALDYKRPNDVHYSYLKPVTAA